MVRRGGNPVEQHRHRYVALRHMPDRGIRRAGHQPPGEPAVRHHHLGRGSRGRAQRVRGRVGQRAALHRGVWRMSLQRRRHCGEWTELAALSAIPEGTAPLIYWF